MKKINNKYQKDISFKIISRAESILYFLKEFANQNNTKDVAWFRPILILMSYSFELILKARIVNISDNNKIEIEKELKDIGHDIIKMSQYLGLNQLNKIGIESISNKNTNTFIGYTIKTTNNKKIIIEDFTEIRYDFMKNNLRKLEEHKTVIIYINELIEISNKVKGLIQ